MRSPLAVEARANQRPIMRVKDKKGKWEASVPRSFSLLYRSSSRVSVVYSVFWAAGSVQVSRGAHMEWRSTW